MDRPDPIRPDPSRPDPSRVARGVVEHYDARAATYDANLMHRSLAAEVAGLVARDATDGGVVLDAGTGTGLVLRAVPPSLVRIGVDLSPGMLRVARGADPRLHVVRADLARLPLPAGSVSAIACVTVLHLLHDPVAVMHEWRRCLRPGGAVWTATFVPRGDPPPPRAGDPLLLRAHDAVGSADQVAALARAAGLELMGSHESDHDLDRLLLCRLGRSDSP